MKKYFVVLAVLAGTQNARAESDETNAPSSQMRFYAQSQQRPSSVRPSRRSEFATERTPKKKYNLRINPLSLVFGTLSGFFDIRAGRQVTIGPQLGFVTRSSSLVTVVGYSLGARVNFTPNVDVMTDGFYIGPSLSYTGVYVTFKDSSLLSDINIGIIDLSTNFGYQWFWTGGFNILLGGGLGYYIGDNRLLLYSGSHLTLEFSLGYAF